MASRKRKVKYYTIDQLYTKKLEENITSRPLSLTERLLTYLALLILFGVVIFALFNTVGPLQ